MDIEADTQRAVRSYQARLRARQEELSALRDGRRHHLSARARARSAERWQSDDARSDQERRASCLRVVVDNREEVVPPDRAS